MLARDLAMISAIIHQLRIIDTNKFSDNQALFYKLNRIKTQASMPFCAEQVILLLVEILSLKHEHQVRDKDLPVELKPNDDEYIKTFIRAIMPLLGREIDNHLLNIFGTTVENFLHSLTPDQKSFFQSMKSLSETNLTCIDINFVMECAEQVRKDKSTLNKNAILVLGVTGAGKSFVINYLGSEEMFSRSRYFGNKLKVDTSKQPDFLKNIKIDGSTVSATSEMGVVEVDKIKTKSMQQFHGKGYVICDTPGANDNRNALGQEFKLANGLKIVAPMYKADSVRFLVIISATANDARGEQFRNTIKFISKMFATTNLMMVAAKSMVFAINGEDSVKNFPEFIRVLNDFIVNKVALKFDDKDMILLNALKEKFDAKQVQVIRPLADGSAKPEQLLGMLEKCVELNPKILTPFAESNLEKLVEQEASLLGQSIARILESFTDEDLSNEVMALQIQRLTHKFAKLSFMDAYYSTSKTNLEPNFDKLVELMQLFQSNLITTQCPENGPISAKNSEKAMMYIERLQYFDKLVNMITYSSFSENRDLVVSFLKAFNKTVKPESNYKTCDANTWSAWIHGNLPNRFASKVQDEIIKYRASLFSRLQGLLKISVSTIQEQRVLGLASLINRKVDDVPSARIVTLHENVNLLDLIHNELKEEIGGRIDFSLEKHAAVVSERVEIEKAKLIQGDFNKTMQDVVNNLHLYNQHLTELFADDEKDHVAETMKTHFNTAKESLITIVNTAIKNGNFKIALAGVQYITKLAGLFNLLPEVKTELEATLKQMMDTFMIFVEETTKILDITKEAILTEETVQILLLTMNIIHDTKAFPTFATYVASLYPTKMQMTLDSMTAALSNRVKAVRQELGDICRQDYTPDTFAKIDAHLQQLWYLVSLPFDHHDQLANSYSQKIATGVNSYCMKLTGEFSGQLLSDSVVNEAVYQKIKTFLAQLNITAMFEVLNLNEAETALQDALNARAKNLVDKSSLIDLSLGHEDNLVKNAEIIKEILSLKTEFGNHLSTATTDEMAKAVEAYNAKILATLNDISTKVSSMATDEAADMSVQDLIQIDKYLIQCRQMGIFETNVSTVSNEIAGYVSAFTKVQNQVMSTRIATLYPSENASVATTLITDKLNQFSQLKTHISALYTVCDDPISAWVKQLAELVSAYRASLSDAMKAATLGEVSGHEVLLNRVNDYQVFDTYIKQYNQDGTKPLTFKSLYKQFVNAFNVEYFAKIKGVMLALFANEFEKAQQLATEDKVLAPGTEMRLILIEQIGTFISAAVSALERTMTQLKSTPTFKPSCMNELMQSYGRIKAAQTLVEAGLLSNTLLTKRDQLILDTQSVIDSWFYNVLAKIDANITDLNLKLVGSQLNDLQETLTAMELKPTNVDTLMADVRKRFHAKLPECLNQYKNPLNTWNSNTYTLAQVATAFLEAKDLPYEDGFFGLYWGHIAAQVYDAINDRCADIEKEFSLGGISIEAAVKGLEQIASLTAGLPVESYNLAVKIKERYQKTVAQIQKDSLETKKDEVRLAAIRELLTASDRFATTLGVFDLTEGTAYISSEAEKLRKDILESFDKQIVPQGQLIFFAGLHKSFSASFSFLNDDHDLYARRVTELVDHASESIRKGHTMYGKGSDQDAALLIIHSKLVLLLTIQQLATATKDIINIVNPDLPMHVVTLLLDVKNLLLSNNDKFRSALEGRNITTINVTLQVALAFQNITMDIEQYINACNMAVLPDEFVTLKQLNNDYSYIALRNRVTGELHAIQNDLTVLKPKSLATEGKAIRQAFYIKLRRDIEFINNMPTLSDHLTFKVLSDKALARDFGLEQCLKALATFLEETFRLAYNKLQVVAVPTVTSEWDEFNRYYQELTIFVDECQGAETLVNLKLSQKMLLGDNGVVAPSTSSSPSSIMSVLNSMMGGSSSSSAPIIIDDKIEAFLVVQFLAKTFENYLAKLTSDFAERYTKENDPSDDLENELVNLLAGLQKMAEDILVLSSNIKAVIKQFLNRIQANRSGNYLASLAERLRSEEEGYGARIIAEQSVFAGMMTAERNEMTKGQTIEYVLKNTEVQDKASGYVLFLDDYASGTLLDQYNEFETLYGDLISLYTSAKSNFAKFSESHLETLRANLLTDIEQSPPQRDQYGHIIWDQSITQRIPLFLSYLFAIWTLKESAAYFEASNTDSNANFLKKPHPAQMIAIFQMLNTVDSEVDGLPSQLNEVLTGQGKSVVLAVTASLLALLGFAADVGCYSEYLSKRDEQSFKWFFEFLGVDKFIQYGTFNSLSEKLLNQNGDLRDLMNNALFDEGIETKPEVPHGRQTIAMVDEIDSLVTAVYAYMYQPYFLLNNNLISALLDAVWNRHINGAMTSLKSLLDLQEYKKCLEAYPNQEYILRHAASEMYADLSRYKREQGHDFYVNGGGTLYYKHFDGTAMNKRIGYRTYWACLDPSNNVSPSCKEKNRGLMITCGNYSYAEVMRNKSTYRVILGVTGTYRELSATEKNIVKQVFGITGVSFIPSAYGKNKLKFNPGDQVKVVEDDDINQFDLVMTEEIAKTRIGWNNAKQQRPVLVFFETQESLKAFYNSEAFKQYRQSGLVNIMSSETITSAQERDSYINKATRAGVITLAVQEYGRGSDFIVSNLNVIANGGMGVIDGFMPETAADERQHRGRAARQGQEGSFSIVLKKSEIINKFGLTAAAIDEARRTGKLYETISDARNKKFAKSYQLLVDDSAEMVAKLHNPSMQLLNTIAQTRSTDHIIAAHKCTLPSLGANVIVNGASGTTEAHVLILLDSTGSMENLIGAVKSTISAVVENLSEVLKAEGRKFLLQIGHYKDYDSADAFTHSAGWSCDSRMLKQFISEISATGGGGDNAEAVEFGLYHANVSVKQLAKQGKKIDHVIVVGDEPPKPVEQLEYVKKHYNGYAGYDYVTYNKIRHFLEEAKELADNKVPVSTYYIRTDTFKGIKDYTRSNDGHEIITYRTQTTFKEISDMTGGESAELDVSVRQVAIKQVTTLFATKIIGAAVGADATQEYKDELFQKFEKRMQTFGKS